MRSQVGECFGCGARAYQSSTERADQYTEPHAPECPVYRTQLEDEARGLAELDATLAEGKARLALPRPPAFPGRHDDLRARARAEWEEEQRLYGEGT